MSRSRRRLIVLFVTLSVFFLIPKHIALARVTPEDIVNEKRAEYESRVKNYSSDHKVKLEALAKRIDEINQQRSFELQQNVMAQGIILDEYMSRHPKDSGIEDVRYWITFAHEAISYQKARIYIYNLSSESNIKGDALNLISQFSSDLNSIRTKTIKSQKLLEALVKND